MKKREIGKYFIAISLYFIGMFALTPVIGVSLATDMITVKQAVIIGILYFLPVILLIVTFLLTLAALLFLSGKVLKNSGD